MLSSVPEALGHAPGEMYYRRADRRYLSRSIILWHLQKFQAVVESSDFLKAPGHHNRAVENKGRYFVICR
jgi:hypothetical protein